MPIADRPPACRIVRRDNGVDADSIDRLSTLAAGDQIEMLW
jgi:hypothetical protein